MPILIAGKNDLKTLYPEIAKEANGWDPSTLLAGTEKKMSWKCEKGHIWFASLKSRTRSSQWSNGTGCPECAVSGFKASKPAWFYLMARPGEQQIGITNDLSHRFSYHGAKGWNEIDSTGPHSGYLVVETENAIKKWLRKEIGLIPGTHENWYTSRMEVNSLAELKKISGVVTSIF